MKINIMNEQEIKKIDESKVEDVVRKVILGEFEDGDFEINILITDNSKIQELNEEYRSKDGPTDVLSFEYGLTEEVIGDIVLSVERIDEQAPEFGNTFEEEFYFNLIHGVLHILGYDHIDNDEEEKEMFDLQEDYFQKLIKNQDEK